jgi:hypothetical protein
MPEVARVHRRVHRTPCALLLSLALIACGSSSDRAAPSPAAAPARDTEPALRPKHDFTGASGPPEVPFVAARPWQSTREGSAPIAPPPLETWRALVSQHQPHQTKTPRWQPLPATDRVELKMPPGSGFRCVVTPLQVTADADDFGTRLEAWVMTRNLLCSGDGFRRWTEHVHSVRLASDGARETSSEAAALLRERDAGPVVRHSYVVVRADEENRQATTGPPRILPGVAVDDD